MKNAKPTTKQHNNGYSSLRGYSNLNSISCIIVFILIRTEHFDNKVGQTNNKLANLIEGN